MAFEGLQLSAGWHVLLTRQAMPNPRPVPMPTAACCAVLCCAVLCCAVTCSGEIACRVLTTAKRLGIPTVAVFRCVAGPVTEWEHAHGRMMDLM
jgi:hypothetical protein